MKLKKKPLALLVAVLLIIAFLYLKSSPEQGQDVVGTVISDLTEGGVMELPVTDSGDTQPAPATEAEAVAEDAEEPGPEADVTQGADSAPEAEPEEEDAAELTITEDGVYDSKEEVALYLHLYGHLPSNYITKKDAMDRGWSGNGGDKLDQYCPGMCIGGNYFGNNEGLLPKAPGRKWTECDIDTMGAKNRGVKRIVFSNDGLIYYTEDHYESFELLYGEP